MASVPLTRGPGVFGQLTVTFRVVSGSAVEGRDFLSPHGEVVIADGDTTAVINVTLVDDPEMEFDEQFTLHLVGVKGRSSSSSSSRVEIFPRNSYTILCHDFVFYII